jgi:hypothetical protein
MLKAANISIHPNAQLNICIQLIDGAKAPYATIINNAGDAIEHIPLQAGNNTINISPYLYQNYAIRVVNGKNVTVQKI